MLDWEIREIDECRAETLRGFHNRKKTIAIQGDEGDGVHTRAKCEGDETNRK